MNRVRLTRGLLMARTVRRLRPAQVAHRLRLHGQRAAIRAVPPWALDALVPAAGSVPGWPIAFHALDEGTAPGQPSPRANAEGRFELLGESRDLGRPPAWDAPGASRLWRYHLHYFEWAWSFAVHPDRPWAREAFAALWRSWRASTAFGRGDAWSPYVASLRAWALCGVHAPLWGGSDAADDIARDLSRHAVFLRSHMELDVGGNHLMKNLKALCGLGVFLGDEALVARTSRRLQRQLPVQVLSDGGHFERSPSYHCQVLGDLLDVARLLDAAGQPAVPGMSDAVALMQRWLGAMLMPDGDVPLFNDCVLVGRDRVAQLQPVPRPGDEQLSVLWPSGYVVMRPGDGVQVVADVGPPCPPDLPAHAHADCLSFELAVGGERVVVNSGTSTYEPGPRRAYERATKAHNTVEVDSADQTEVWSTFRAARRAVPTLEAAAEGGGVIEVTASHDGYERLRGRPRHRRTWRATTSGLELVDVVTGTGRHGVRAYLHLPSTSLPLEEADGTISARRITVAPAGPPGTTVEVRDADVAVRFGRPEPGGVVVTSFEGPLPVELRTDLVITGAGARSTGALEVAPSKGEP